MSSTGYQIKNKILFIYISSLIVANLHAPLELRLGHTHTVILVQLSKKIKEPESTLLDEFHQQGHGVTGCSVQPTTPLGIRVPVSHVTSVDDLEFAHAVQGVEKPLEQRVDLYVLTTWEQVQLKGDCIYVVCIYLFTLFYQASLWFGVDTHYN